MIMYFKHPLIQFLPLFPFIHPTCIIKLHLKSSAFDSDNIVVEDYQNSNKKKVYFLDLVERSNVWVKIVLTYHVMVFKLK